MEKGRPKPSQQIKDHLLSEKSRGNNFIITPCGKLVQKPVEKSVERCYTQDNVYNFYGGKKGWQLFTKKQKTASL